MVFTPYPNEVFSTFSFLGFIMCMIPLPWHIKTRNVGTCLYMFWTGIGCLILFINSIVWHGNAYNPAPRWCDVCTKILIGTSIGIPASSLCINRRLYLVQLDAAGNVAITKSKKLLGLATDLGISVGLPLLIMILHYIPQGHRFDILEDIGCYPHTYNTWVGVLVVNVPPVLIGIVSSTYAIRAVISINKRRTEFNELLARNMNVTSSLYYRLMTLAGIEALLTTPIAGLFVVYNVSKGHLRPWISWEDTHSYFYRVQQIPAIIWHSIPNAWLFEFGRWIYIICAILFFSFFGFAEEARFHYRLTFEFFLKVIGIRTSRQSEIITFQAGPLSQSDRLTFANKRGRRADSFSTISGGCSENGGEEWSGTSSHDTHDYAHDHLGTQTDSPSDSIASQAVIETARRDSLISSKDAHVSADVDVEQENPRRPSVSSRITQNFRSFLNLGHNDPSTKHASFSQSSQSDIATIEEGRPSNSRCRSSRRFSRYFRSFLNLN